MNKKVLTENQISNQKGITLIALVITIVILIILATISINFVFNGGLIDRAEQARDYYQNDEAYTDESVSNLTGYIDGLINGIEGGSGGSGTGEKPTTIDEAKGKGVLGEETVLADNAGNKVTVPGEFGVSADSGSNVKDGVVIEDGEGNQYVWVPVTKDENGENTTPYSETGTLADGTEIKLSRYIFDEEGVSTDRGEDYINSNIEYGGSMTPVWVAYEEVEYLEEFKLSVAENGGYYIARYEASYGTDGKANSKISAQANESAGSLQEGTLWNFITQTDAMTASQNLYMETNSELINSYAWDTALLYIQKCSGNNQYSRATAPSDTLANTGSGNDEICKINDLSGNLGEWTTEDLQFPGTTPRNGVVCRGGRYDQPSYYTAFRGENNTSFEVFPTDTAPDMGFRVILYI